MADLSINIKSQRINNGIKAENLEKYFQSLTNNKISVGVHKDKGQDNLFLQYDLYQTHSISFY